MNLVSPNAFAWFLTIVTGASGAIWGVRDVSLLWRARKLDRGVGVNRDKQFGYAMGIVIGAIGVIGALKFQGAI